MTIFQPEVGRIERDCWVASAVDTRTGERHVSRAWGRDRIYLTRWGARREAKRYARRLERGEQVTESAQGVHKWMA